MGGRPVPSFWSRMNAEYGVSGAFSALHAGCGLPNLHGHTYRVQVFVTGEPRVEDGAPLASEGLGDALRNYLALIDRQSLEQVMPGAATSVTGLAAKITGELLGHYPRITEVVVTDETDTIGRMRRTPRAL
jgi:6-pyruvoyl-tetrahydropterin synthase